MVSDSELGGIVDDWFILSISLEGVYMCGVFWLWIWSFWILAVYFKIGF